MPQGLEVRNAAGVVELNISTRVLKFLTVADLVVGTPANVSVNLPSAGTNFVGVSVSAEGGITGGNMQPNYSLSGNVVQFTWPAGSDTGKQVKAGIFLY